MPKPKKTPQDRAKQVLEGAGIVAPPVDPARIAGLHGIDVRFEPFEHEQEDVSGVLIRDAASEARVVIGVNSLHHPNRQRFTIAHELGHYFLHQGALFVDGGAMPMAFRNKKSAEATDPREIQANAFAAALLMPERWLRDDVDHHTEITDRLIEDLATKYRVSVMALTLRLVNLSLIRQSVTD